MKLTLETIIQRNNDILASDIDGEKVMMSIEQGEYYGMGKTGSYIWDSIENPIKIQDLIEKITQIYNVSFNDCYNDTISFLTDLLEKELIVATK